ncbi:MAG: cytochrome P450 [Gemmatimonadetes bacterium]|nr:cytochrome P450 [Gemmatimonadota bacterium]
MGGIDKLKEKIWRSSQKIHPLPVGDLSSFRTLGRTADELPRFNSPIQMTLRRARADAAASGFQVRTGDNVAVPIGAANRDPDAFEEPDRLDVGRVDCPHLSLGRGIHHCLGTQLARLEGRVAFEMLLERFPRIELLGPRPKYHHGVVLRSLRSLPLRCRRA